MDTEGIHVENFATPNISRSVQHCFEHLNSYFQSLNLYFEKVADTGGGGAKGGSNQFVLFRSKWNKETRQYISI